jgi:hypothetical protein
MEMIRQDADRNRFERVFVLNCFVDSTQPIDVPHQKVARSIGERDREEKSAALNLCTAISRHNRS